LIPAVLARLSIAIVIGTLLISIFGKTTPSLFADWLVVSPTMNAINTMTKRIANRCKWMGLVFTRPTLVSAHKFVQQKRRNNNFVASLKTLLRFPPCSG
jgi:hypothetical protein